MISTSVGFYFIRRRWLLLGVTLQSLPELLLPGLGGLVDDVPGDADVEGPDLLSGGDDLEEGEGAAPCS